MALVLKNRAANAGDIRDTGLIPVLGGPPGGGNVSLLYYSCLENPMDRGAWRATVHRVAQSQTQLQQFTTHTYSNISKSGIFWKKRTRSCLTQPGEAVSQFLFQTHQKKFRLSEI